MTAIEPFTIDVADAALDDLHTRLRATRWPESATTSGWEQGPPLDYLRDLCEYWTDGYDWRATESRLNRLPQFRTVVDGVGIHFAHVRSSHPGAVPLVMTHGWPGSFLEFERVIGPLTEGSPPFHVVCPSLPGYAFSGKPAGPGWTVERIADAWAELMSRLGYDRFLAQGHDWGTSVSTALAQRHPARVRGLHLVPPLAAPDPATFGDLTEAERAALADLDSSDDGYSLEHRTRPQTIGYGLVDSPLLQLAWIAEKVHEWTDLSIDRDQLLTTVSLYWFTGCGATVAHTLYEQAHSSDWGAPPAVPQGFAVFGADETVRRLVPAPADAHWSEFERGRHFPAMEAPAELAADLRDFFQPLS
jgi:pimeloyl-ACP methyl ester carboxylesterase